MAKKEASCAGSTAGSTRRIHSSDPLKNALLPNPLCLRGVIALAIIGVTFGLSEPSRALTQTQFAVPPALKHQVDFWRDVFTKYVRRQVVVHDTHRLDRVYSVLDFRHLDEQGLGEAQIELTIEKAVAREKKRIRGVLLRLHRLGPNANLTEEELRIGELFRSDKSPQKFYFAASKERIRAQWGLRERFAKGITVGHRYFPAMEAIFRQEGVPIELTRLPLVESTFNIHSYSKVGAAGIWQFMPSTGRQFLRIDDAVDERLDPLVATRAAARYLRGNYEQLGTWPLALTGYNHGPDGIAPAVRQLGTTDVVVLIEQYRGRRFGFASRNFYPEFLAALEVERNHRQYFGPLPLGEPRPTDDVELRHYLPLPAVTTCAGGGSRGNRCAEPGSTPHRIRR